MNEVETPQFELPFRIEGTRAVEIEQDSAEEIGDCIETLFRTPLGSVEEEPELGIVDPTFEEHVDLSELQTAVTEWEGRAPTMLEESPDGLELINFVRRVNVEARIRAEV